jgi:hypothetical protein
VVDPLPLLFRTDNPTRNAAVPARPQTPMIAKTLPPFFRVKAFAIMENRLSIGEGGSRLGFGSSSHYYNTEAEIAQAVAAVAELATERP